MSDDRKDFMKDLQDNVQETELTFDGPEYAAFVVVPDPSAEGRPAIFSIPEYMAEMLYAETECPSCGNEYTLMFKHPSE